MSSKNKARKIFKKLREAKLDELRQKEYDKKKISSSDNFKELSSDEFVEQNKLIENIDTKLKESKDLEVNSNDFNSSSNLIDIEDDSDSEPKDFKESKDIKDLEVNSNDFNSSSNLIDIEDDSDSNEEIFKDFQKSNEKKFVEQNKLIVGIKSKLEKFEQKLFHSQGGEKTALPKKGFVSKLSSAKNFVKNESLKFAEENPQAIDGLSSGIGFLTAGLASLGFGAIGSGYDFITDKIFGDEKNESSTDAEVVKNTNELSPKDIEKMEAEENKDQTKEKAPNETPKNYLKKKTSLLSYLPFFKEKEEYALSDEVHNMLKTDGNLKEKELILNEVKNRGDVDESEIKKLEEHIAKLRNIEKEKEEEKKSKVYMDINMSKAELAKNLPEYDDERKKLGNDPKYKSVAYRTRPPIYYEQRNAWDEWRKADNDLFVKYAKKFAATVDPTIMDVTNYKGEKLSPEEYAPEYFKKETQDLANEARVTIKNSSESVTGVDKSLASNNTTPLDNKATSPASVMTPKIEKELPTSSESYAKPTSTSTATPVEPQKEVKEGKVLPANASGSDTVSQGEATAADNSSSTPSKEASPTKSPQVSATPSNASPSVPASVSPTTNSNNVELSGASKQLAKDTVGTEPKPDTITNESVVNNQVVEKIPESPWDKFDNAELTKSQDEFLRGK